MRQSNYLLAALAMAMLVLSFPTPDNAEEASQISAEEHTTTGFTEEGVPYNITRGIRKLAASEIAEWNAMTAFSGGIADLEKRSGGGTNGNCNQWYSDKYCYCSGAISNRGDCYHGSIEHCEANTIDKGHAGIYGHGESYTLKWMPTVRINYKITNYCGWTYEVTMGMCGTPFLDLIDWCQWTWEAQKGGKFRLNDCIQYSFDVNVGKDSGVMEMCVRPSGGDPIGRRAELRGLLDDRNGSDVSREATMETEIVERPQLVDQLPPETYIRKTGETLNPQDAESLETTTVLPFTTIKSHTTKENEISQWLPGMQAEKECPGYRKSFRWSTKYEVLQPPHMKEPRWPQRHVEVLTSSLQNLHYAKEVDRFQKPQDLDIAIFVPSSNAPSPAQQVSPAESNESFGYTSSAESVDIPFANASNTSDNRRRDSRNDQLSDSHIVKHAKECNPYYPVMGKDSTNDYAHFAEPSERQRNLDLAALLTEYWYTDACRKYSTFDSDTNKTRQLAMSLSQRSKGVSCAMQSMSAACLMETLPQARAILSTLTSKALSAIRQDLAGFLSARALVHMGVPVEALFATFALGTAMLWSNSRELAFSLRDKASKMLDLCDLDHEPSNSQERKDFDYFRSCLVQWDSHSFLPSPHLECKLASLRCTENESFGTIHDYNLRKLLLGEKGDITASRPWTEGSGEPQELFALVLGLCQQERAQQQQHYFGNRTPSLIDDTTSNDTMAYRFRNALLALRYDDAPPSHDEFGSRSLTDIQTSANDTPRAFVAEAFRLSALLHLNLTFWGLNISQEMPSRCHRSPMKPHSTSEQECTSSRRHKTSEIALRLIEVLTQLNAESGTAYIQPLLYLSAATGLKYGCSSTEHSCLPDVERYRPKSRHDSGIESYEQLFESFADPSFITSPGSSLSAGGDASTVVTSHTWKIARARHQVIKNLMRLQEHLPPRIGEVTLQLIKTVWAVYDSGDREHGKDAHWLDVVGALGLQTLFG
ncbi:hypothetical protein Q7P37_006244 [Cladosporium fusiforme]